MTRKLIPDSLWVCILNVGTLKTTYRSLFVCLFVGSMKNPAVVGVLCTDQQGHNLGCKSTELLDLSEIFQECVFSKWITPNLPLHSGAVRVSSVVSSHDMTWHDSKQAHLLQTGKTHVNHSNNWPMMVSQHLSNDHFFKENLSIVFLFFSIAQHFPETQSS